jgi:hypothetical protein
VGGGGGGGGDDNSFDCSGVISLSPFSIPDLSTFSECFIPLSLSPAPFCGGETIAGGYFPSYPKCGNALYTSTIASTTSISAENSTGCAGGAGSAGDGRREMGMETGYGVDKGVGREEGEYDKRELPLRSSILTPYCSHHSFPSGLFGI